MRRVDQYVSPSALQGRSLLAALARWLGFGERKDCLARRQGRCPGRDQCHDCAWAEGMSRQV